MLKKHKPFVFFTLITCLLFVGSLQASEPLRYLNGSDGALTRVTNPDDGVQWAAWAYNNGGEFDLAISSMNSMGLWREPELIGEADRLDQVDPVLTADGAGNLYLVYGERPGGRIMLTTKRVGEARWSSATQLNPAKLAGRLPTVRIVADRLVIAFQTKHGVSLHELQLLEAPILGHTTDDPDPVGSNKPIKTAAPVEEQIGSESGTGTVEFGESSASQSESRE